MTTAKNKLFDDYDDEYDSGLSVGCGSGRGQYFANPIGFGKELSAPFRLPLQLVYDATGDDIVVRLYTCVNGSTYELQTINKKARLHLIRNLYGILGDKHYEHD